MRMRSKLFTCTDSRRASICIARIPSCDCAAHVGYLNRVEVGLGFCAAQLERHPRTYESGISQVHTRRHRARPSRVLWSDATRGQCCTSPVVLLPEVVLQGAPGDAAFNRASPIDRENSKYLAYKVRRRGDKTVTRVVGACHNHSGMVMIQHTSHSE